VNNFHLKTDKSNLRDSWPGFLQSLLQKFGKATFDSWFKTLSLVEENKNTIYFGVRSRFVKDWIIANYQNKLFELVKECKPELLEIEILVNKSDNVTSIISDQQMKETNIVVDSSLNSNDNNNNFSANLDKKYVFDNFIVGDENKLAYTAINSFLSNQELISSLNMMYIYSKVGLGKSHLLGSLASQLQKNHANYVFLTSERFTYHYTRFIRSGDLLGFKEKFQDIDYFLLDDLHFLQGKKATQQEVLSIIEHLVQDNKKVVIVADRKFSDLNDFNHKLMSLMSSGIVATIDNPGLDLKQRIIQHKCDLNNYDLNKELITFLASQNFSSVREIEGAINKLMIYKNIFAKEINQENILPIIEDFITKQQIQKLNPESMIRNIAKYFRVSVTELKSKNRKKELVLARNIAIYLIKENTSLSLNEIGKYFSNRDHATILYSYNKIRSLQNLDLTLKFEIDKVLDYLRSV
jgi:chromosomal replication initiator protein